MIQLTGTGAPPEGIQVAGACVWARREGLFRHMIGVAFRDMDGGTLHALDALARTHGIGLAVSEPGVQREAA